MAIGDSLNWRRGIDTLQQSNDKVAQALAQRQAQVAQQTQVAEERNRYQTSQIVQGIKGIGDAIDKEEERAQKKVLFDQQTTLNAFDISHKVVMDPLQEQHLRDENAGLKASTQDTLQRTQMAKTEADKQSARIAAESDGIIAAATPELRAKMPKMLSPESQANWIKANQAEKGTQLDQNAKIATTNKTEADIANLNATTEHTKVGTALDEMKIGKAANMNVSQLNAARLNPALRPYLVSGADPEDPVIKAAAAKDAENFKTITGKADAVNGQMHSFAAIAAAGGTDIIDPKTGKVDPEKAATWANNAGGISGYIDQIRQKPNANAIQMELSRVLLTELKDGTFPSFRTDAERKFGAELAGKTPIPTTGDEATSFLGKFSQMMASKNMSESYFTNSLSRIDGMSQEVLQDFRTNNAFQYIGSERKKDLLTKVAPFSVRQVASYDEMMKMTADQLTLNVYGKDAAGQPNYVPPQHWRDLDNFGRQLDDTTEFNKMAAGLQGKPFKTGDAHIDDQIAQAKGLSDRALNLTAAPGAKVGTKPGEDISTSAEGAGFATNTSTGNATGLVVYDALYGKFRAASEPSGLPAVGASPSEAHTPGYSEAVKTKYDLNVGYQDKNYNGFQLNGKKKKPSETSYAK